jgi:hypothetical protein
MRKTRKSESELWMARSLRALTIAKILFEDQGYHTHYLEEIECFLQRSELMQQQACLEVRSALEIWLTSGTRTLERLDLLVRHWCEVYARDEEYTTEALVAAKHLASRHIHRAEKEEHVPTENS